jgi:hypothetical protein
MTATHNPRPDRTRIQRAPRVVVMGGLTRLSSHYSSGLLVGSVEVANADSALLARNLGSFDAVVVVPTHLSHRAARRILDAVDRLGRPVLLSLGPGVRAVRRAIDAVLREVA